ncbi:hypothetical protein M0R45_030019 [Rubus argutus]|uniref:Uncharacterized protein n=1 Tax=Rubus argutus TaxID=59490 RepID=A0AAW1WDN8_RUBAR
MPIYSKVIFHFPPTTHPQKITVVDLILNHRTRSALDHRDAPPFSSLASPDRHSISRTSTVHLQFNPPQKPTSPSHHTRHRRPQFNFLTDPVCTPALSPLNPTITEAVFTSCCWHLHQSTRAQLGFSVLDSPSRRHHCSIC